MPRVRTSRRVVCTAQRAAAVCLVAGAVFAATPGLADEAASTLTVSGSGRVQAAPDAATLDAGVTTQARRAKDAIHGNSRAMEALLAALGDQTIDSKDIQTRQLQLTPVYPQGGRRAGIEGYRASSRVRVRVREIDRVGSVLDALVEAGANELGSISFTVLDPEPFLDRARAAAVADARRKAALFASEAGVRLGRILEIRDGAVPTPLRSGRGAFRGEALAAQSIPVAAGELEFSAQVSLVYAVDNPE